MPELSKVELSKAIKKYAIIFVPKYRAFHILQNNIEDVVQKSKQMWKITYGFSTTKEVDQVPIEVGEDEEDDNEQGIVEGGNDMNIDNQTLAEEEQQLEQSVQDTLVSSVSPPQVTSVNTETIKVKDISDTTAQNVNPLTKEDLKRILF